MNRRPTPTVDLSPDPKLAGCLPATAPLERLATDLRRLRAELDEDPGAVGELIPLALTVSAAEITAPGVLA